MALTWLIHCTFGIGRGRMTFGGQTTGRQVCNGVRIGRGIWTSSAQICADDVECRGVHATVAAET
ncbi:MAG: hypothetical protein IT552_09185 [Sphingomonadaceae bacterium]|nr:hypothetical protein [Sphingomonadaceae bacterium]